MTTATAEAPMAHAGLATEHAELLREVRARAGAVRDALAAGRRPAASLERLVGYLRYEVVDQAVHEERLLFPLGAEGKRSDPRLVQLAEDHVCLRDLTDVLARAAQTGDASDVPANLDALLARLGQHLADEEDVLSGAAGTGVESVRQPTRRHEWFPLTEGPVVDMDLLPPASAVAAAVDRLTRMRAGEVIEIRSGRSLEPLLAALYRRGMSGDLGWSYLQEGPDLWAAAVIRRAPSE